MVVTASESPIVVVLRWVEREVGGEGWWWGGVRVVVEVSGVEMYKLYHQDKQNEILYVKK